MTRAVERTCDRIGESLRALRVASERDLRRLAAAHALVALHEAREESNRHDRGTISIKTVCHVMQACHGVNICSNQYMIHVSRARKLVSSYTEARTDA